MKPQHVIYLASSEVILYTWDRLQYVPVSGYALPDGDPTSLVNYLRQTPAAVVAILVDVLEEEHHRDTIARLGRRDQAAMLARKLARTFPRTPYRTGVVQGRLPNDPLTTRILLSGLTKAEHLRTLQGLLADAKLPVAAVCSPALLSRPLLDKLRPGNPAGATLLVSRQREGSLRLTFFRGRDLVGSRLMRRSLAAPPGDIERLVRQLEESVRYFDAAFAPSASNPVDVLLLCEPDGELGEGSGHEGFRLSVPAPGEIVSKLGLRCGLTPGNADQLFVELVRHYSPAGNFAPPADRRYFHLYQVRTIGRAACLALAAGTILGSVLNVVGILGVVRETAAVQSSIRNLTTQLSASLSGEHSNGADPLEMERIANAWQLLQKHAVDPRDVLGLVSAAVDSNPQVQIEGIEWAPLQAVTADSGDEAAGPGDTVAGTDAAPGAAPGDEQVRLIIRGRVEPFDGNYPLAFLDIRTFMQSLRADPRVVSVKALKEPLDVGPQSTLTGEITPGPKIEKAGFTINVVLRVVNEPA